MKKITKFGHQGDISFRKIDKLPEGLKPLEYDTKRGGYTLALGEVTNHAHTLIVDQEDEMVQVLKAATGKQYLVIKKEVELKHGTFIAPTKIDERETDKHASIIFQPGIYEQGAESEYDPFSRMIRSVQD